MACKLLNIFLEKTWLNIYFSVEECYYAWSERGNPQTCTKSSDCDTKGAICVYSVMNQQHICCQNKENAILPSI